METRTSERSSNAVKRDVEYIEFRLMIMMTMMGRNTLVSHTAGEMIAGRSERHALSEAAPAVLAFHSTFLSRGRGKGFGIPCPTCDPEVA